MTTEPRTTLSPGHVIAGRYRVERILGQGGMGLVLEARDLESTALVAIKCLLPAHRRNPEVLARFQREARAAERLTSEHVVRVLASGEIEGEGHDPPVSYLVMEHLDGHDLKTLLQRKGVFSARRAADYVSQACLALAEAHALGIVHRDLKPANLFRTWRGDRSNLIKVIDFGVAKFTSPNTSGDDADLTEVSMMIGTVPFLAPEQLVDARSADARADVWSLGVVLFELVSGAKPFVGERHAEVAMEMLTGEPRPLGTVQPDLPPGFAPVVMRCLQKRVEDRWPSVVELARALAPFAERRPGSSPGRQLINRTQPLSDETMRKIAVDADDSLLNRTDPGSPGTRSS